MGTLNLKQLNGVCYGKGRFIAIETDGKTAYSTDGKSWAPQAQFPGSDWRSICYGNGMFVAVGQNGGSPIKAKIAYSTNGINWAYTEDDKFSTDITYESVCYGNGKFIAAGGDSFTGRIAYSTDGINWKELPEETLGSMNVLCLNSISYGLDSDIYGFL